MTRNIGILMLAQTLSALCLSEADAWGENSTPKAGPAETSGGIKRVLPGRMLVHAPATAPACSKLPTSYELGSCFQLDRDHCLLVSSIDEQGGPDLCVGNDAFIFTKLSDIKAENAIVINRAEPDFKSGTHTGFLAKYHCSGCFVPLGALLPNGKPHPAAGTGLLMSICVLYASDRSDPAAASQDDSNWRSWETLDEFIQIRWDGKNLKITGIEKIRQILGQPFYDGPLGELAPMDVGFVGPCQFEAGRCHAVRFDWNGKTWAPTRFGPAFNLVNSESEASIQHQGDRYLVSTRSDEEPKVRIYSSEDGMNFKFLFEAKNHYVPRVLNQGLDGSIYLATNPGPGFLRNPLLAYPLVGDSFGEPVTIYDQGGVRDDKGDAIPFCDHAQGANIFLEGRWRHFVFYRVCDLKERTLYGYQKSLIKRFHGDKGPIPKRPTSGVYATELEYDKVTAAPYRFADQ